MNLSRFISRRYLFSKNNPNAINVISGISVAGFAVGSMALVVVLSVFNGFESLVQTLYNSFDPDIKVTAAAGKVFYPDSAQLGSLQQLDGVKNVALVLEENVALRYNDRQTIATLKGVSENYLAHTGLDSMLYEGALVLQKGDANFALAGYGIAARLGLSPYNDFLRLAIYVPRRGAEVSYDPERALNSAFIYPSGIFNVEEDINNRYVIVPMRLARELLDFPEQVTSLEISLAAGARLATVQAAIKDKLGPQFQVKNRQEQQDVLYRVFRSEKWATYLILCFILLLLAFTVISSLIMLVLEKRKDISILKSMGATDGLIRRIFFSQGLLISLLGAGIGLSLGFAICWAQQTFGLLKIGGLGTFIIEAYPVKMHWMDFLNVFLTTLFLGLITAIYPAWRAPKHKMTLSR